MFLFVVMKWPLDIPEHVIRDSFQDLGSHTYLKTISISVLQIFDKVIFLTFFEYGHFLIEVCIKLINRNVFNV